MFEEAKPDPNPRGVRLGDLAEMLSATTIKPILVDNGLLADHGSYTVRVEVVPPEVAETPDGEISAVVLVSIDIPKPILEIFRENPIGTAAICNGFAALGSLYEDGDTLRIGSRLTIHEEEDVWAKLHLPLLLFTIIAGAEPILGGMRRTLGREGRKQGVTQWVEEDFTYVEQMLSRICLCTTGGLGLTAEFPLSEGAISAVAGHRKTALWQLLGEQPHPELGGGLFCLLQLPHRIEDEDRLNRICAELNKMEMTAHDMPPHFGAWCPSQRTRGPAYVSFLPNALHSVPGIALNFSIWAMHRAQWANAMMAALGVRV